MTSPTHALAPLQHCRTGISGLDEITSGGPPQGRTSLLAGGPGCGTTLLATRFLVRGAEMGETGVFVAFEETADELTTNVASLGWDLERRLPEPVRKIIGDLSNTERVLIGLDLRPEH